MRVQLDPAFVLHTRPYRNSSLLVDLLSTSHGLVSAVARSARGPKSRYRGILQPFAPLLVSWSGRSELKTLGQVEAQGAPFALTGEALFCGFYLNELLIRLLHREDPHPVLFKAYETVLTGLCDPARWLVPLRLFEKRLLSEVGYGLCLHEAADTRLPIQPEQYYLYLPDRGFILTDASTEGSMIFSGRTLLALHHEKLEDDDCLQKVKRLLRIALTYQLGDKPLKSRSLFAVASHPTR